VFGASALSSLLCFDTVGWVSERVSGLYKLPIIPSDSILRDSAQPGAAPEKKVSKGE